MWRGGGEGVGGKGGVCVCGKSSPAEICPHPAGRSPAPAQRTPSGCAKVGADLVQPGRSNSSPAPAPEDQRITDFLAEDQRIDRGSEDHRLFGSRQNCANESREPACREWCWAVRGPGAWAVACRRAGSGTGPLAAAGSKMGGRPEVRRPRAGGAADRLPSRNEAYNMPPMRGYVRYDGPRARAGGAADRLRSESRRDM